MDDFKGLAVAAIIVLILLVIIFWRVSIIFICKNGRVLKLRTGLITITLFDSRKKERPKKRRYTKKALERRKKKEKKASEKKRRKSQGEPKKEKRKKFNFHFPDDVEDLLAALASLFSDLLGPIIRIGRVKFRYFKLTVASDDPADTAIRYGVISQSAAYFLHILATNAKISKRQLGKVVVDCDFVNDKTTFELSMSVTFSVWRLLFRLAFGGHRLIGKFAKFRVKDTPDEQSTKKIEGHKIG